MTLIAHWLSDLIITLWYVCSCAYNRASAIALSSAVLLEPTLAPRYAVWSGSVITGPHELNRPAF